MLVKDCMTRHPILIPPDMLANDAQQMMEENRIRHIPVVGDGKRLLGLITRQRLALKADFIGSLNVWEISRYLSNLTVKDLMIKAKDVITIDPDRTIERAARILAENKIGCLPVIEENVVVGIISEVDLLHSYQELLGLPSKGIRVTIRMPNRKGEFAKLMGALVQANLGVMGIGTYPTRRIEGFYDVVLKISDITVEEVRAAFSQVPDQEIVDIRDAV